MPSSTKVVNHAAFLDFVTDHLASSSHAGSISARGEGRASFAVWLNNPLRYFLQDDDGEGSAFYGNEVKGPEYFPVEQLIKTRTVKGQKQQLVQFLGYKDSRWIAAGQTEAI